MEFFMPETPGEDAEGLYAALAELCGVPVPPLGERIQSITFEHNGEEWSAIVGQRLRGSRTDQRRRKGGTVDVTTQLRDHATVKAIFPATPYRVVTDARPLGAVVSSWENPFFVGEPSIRRAARFAPPQPVEPGGMPP